MTRIHNARRSHPKEPPNKKLQAGFVLALLYCNNYNRGNFFPSEVNNRETIEAIGANNDTYYLQKRTEKLPLNYDRCEGKEYMLSF